MGRATPADGPTGCATGRAGDGRDRLLLAVMGTHLYAGPTTRTNESASAVGSPSSHTMGCLVDDAVGQYAVVVLEHALEVLGLVCGDLDQRKIVVPVVAIGSADHTSVAAGQ